MADTLKREGLGSSRDLSQTASGASLNPNSGDLWWIAGDGEYGYRDSSEAYEAATDWDPDAGPVELTRARSLPAVWAARIITKRDEDGEEIDAEVQCFNTKSEADAAIAKALGPSAHDTSDGQATPGMTKKDTPQ